MLNNGPRPSFDFVAKAIDALIPDNGSLVFSVQIHVGAGFRFAIAVDLATRQVRPQLGAGVGLSGSLKAGYSTAPARSAGASIIGGGCLGIGCIEAASRPGGTTVDFGGGYGPSAGAYLDVYAQGPNVNPFSK